MPGFGQRCEGRGGYDRPASKRRMIDEQIKNNIVWVMLFIAVPVYTMTREGQHPSPGIGRSAVVWNIRPNPSAVANLPCDGRKADLLPSAGKSGSSLRRRDGEFSDRTGWTTF